MKIVKVDATPSTNTFLKEWCHQNSAENFTVIVANSQTKGRGQVNNSWQSESGKNLTFSVLVQFDDLLVSNQFYISKVVALAVQKVLVKILPNKITVKWPNDIMAGTKKIAGILIENSVRDQQTYRSIIGIGLNVNQKRFMNLPNATSVFLESNQQYDLDELLMMLLSELKQELQAVFSKEFSSIDKEYLKQLYRFGTPAMYKSKDTVFMAKIVGVSPSGKLQVQLENDTVEEYGLKEITFL